MRRSLEVLALVVAATASLPAQTKPSFAGNWTRIDAPNPAVRSGRGGGAMVVVAQQFTATQDEQTLTVASTNAQGVETRNVYNLDGRESRNPLDYGRPTAYRASKAKWDGSRLIITTRMNTNEDSVETRQVWALDSTGTLTIETTRNYSGRPGPGPVHADVRLAADLTVEPTSTTTKATYKKG